MINRYKVYQTAIVFNINISSLDLCLEWKNILFFSCLRLEEWFQSSFTERYFFKFLLIITALIFSCNLLFHNDFSSFNCINHSLDVQHFSFNPKCGLCEWRFVAWNCIFQFLFHITSSCISQNTLILESIWKEINCNIFILHKLTIDRTVVIIWLLILQCSSVKHQPIFLNNTLNKKYFNLHSSKELLWLRKS